MDGRAVAPTTSYNKLKYHIFNFLDYTSSIFFLQRKQKEQTRKKKKRKNTSSLLPKEESVNDIASKKIGETSRGRLLNNKAIIRRSSELCKKIRTLVPFFESVTNRNSTLKKKIFYVLNKDRINMVFLHGTINKINANKRVIITK
jgi:hypothetical protein